MILINDKPTWYVFTFGCGMQHAGYYVRIYGTFEEARRKMFEKYGREWAFQYRYDKWQKDVKARPWIDWEKELEVIE